LTSDAWQRYKILEFTLRDGLPTPPRGSPLHLLEDGYDIGNVQELPGHRGMKRTMIYTRVVNAGFGRDWAASLLPRGKTRGALAPPP